MVVLLVGLVIVAHVAPAEAAGVPGAGLTVAGGNGQGAAANQLNEGLAVAVDAAGNVYVADANNYRVQRWAPGATSGVTVAGGNGAGPAANQISDAYGLALDSSDNVYVVDSENNPVQRWAPGRDQRRDRRRRQRRRPGSQPTQPAVRSSPRQQQQRLRIRQQEQSGATVGAGRN